MCVCVRERGQSVSKDQVPFLSVFSHHKKVSATDLLRDVGCAVDAVRDVLTSL